MSTEELKERAKEIAEAVSPMTIEEATRKIQLELILARGEGRQVVIAELLRKWGV